MHIDEAIKFLRNMQNSVVSETELYGATPCCGFGNMVFPEPEDYAIEEAINALVKLKEYKQLEEDGKLVKLPCKVGDTVWEYRYFGLKEYKVRHIGFDKSENLYFDCDCGVAYSFRCYSEDFGKTVFLTREEAEAKLEEELNGPSLEMEETYE